MPRSLPTTMKKEITARRERRIRPTSKGSADAPEGLSILGPWAR